MSYYGAKDGSGSGCVEIAIFVGRPHAISDHLRRAADRLRVNGQNDGCGTRLRLARQVFERRRRRAF